MAVYYFCQTTNNKTRGEEGNFWRQHSSLNLPTIRLSNCLTGINIQFLDSSPLFYVSDEHETPDNRASTSGVQNNSSDSHSSTWNPS